MSMSRGMSNAKLVPTDIFRVGFIHAEDQPERMDVKNIFKVPQTPKPDVKNIFKVPQTPRPEVIPEFNGADEHPSAGQTTEKAGAEGVGTEDRNAESADSNPQDGASSADSKAEDGTAEEVEKEERGRRRGQNEENDEPKRRDGSKGWTCPDCSEPNKAIRTKCNNCGKGRPAEHVDEAEELLRRERSEREARKKDAEAEAEILRQKAKAAAEAKAEAARSAAEAEAVRQALGTALQSLRELKKLPTKEERQRRFKELLRAWHPDKNPQSVEVVTAVFQRLQAERKRVL